MSTGEHPYPPATPAVEAHLAKVQRHLARAADRGDLESSVSRELADFVLRCAYTLPQENPRVDELRAFALDFGLLPLPDLGGSPDVHPGGNP